MQIAKLLRILNGMAGAFLAGHEPICRPASRADDALRPARPAPLPRSSDWEGRFIADQLFRSSARTSANYHATCRARSRRDFVSKLGMVVEGCDEAVFWLTFIGRAGINETDEQKDLLNEGRDLLAIFVKSAKTASGNP